MTNDGMTNDEPMTKGDNGAASDIRHSFVIGHSTFVI